MAWLTQTKDACHDLFDLHVTAPVLLAGCVARRFWQGREIENRQQSRDIVNVSSISGLNVYPNYRQSVNSAAKAALNYLTGHMSAEYRKIGVRVNAIAPTTFPSRVPTESVAQAIRGLDTAQVSGKVVVVDSEHVA
jgi:NAD(P)-dependent dehydrogenase (short-subunit alcohol dehydrogenase family)